MIRSPSRRALGAVLLLAGACGHAAQESSRPPSLRLRKGELTIGGLRVPATSLPRLDRVRVLEDALKEAPAASRDGLPETCDAREVVLEIDERADLRDALPVLEWLCSGGTPSFVNLHLQAGTTRASLPVLVPLGTAHVPACAYPWHFYWQGRLQGYEEVRQRPIEDVPQSTTTLRMSPLETGEMLVNLSWGPMILPPPLTPDEKGDWRPQFPLVATRPEAWGERPSALEARGSWLARKGAPERDRERVSSLEECRELGRFRGETWSVLPGPEALEVFAAALEGAERPFEAENRMIEWTLFDGGHRPTVAEYLKLLDFARRHKMKGAVLRLPRT